VAEDFDTVPDDLKENYRTLVGSGASTWRDVAQTAEGQGARDLARWAASQGRSESQEHAAPKGRRSAEPTDKA
jgi:hypothetical protein